MELLNLVVPGDPKTKDRPRLSAHGRTYTPKRTVDAEKVIKGLAAAAIAEPYDRPVGIAMTFYTATKRRSDGDNMQKLVMDALNKIAFTDDYLVEESFWRLHRKAPDEEPRTEILVYTLEDDT